MRQPLKPFSVEVRNQTRRKPVSTTGSLRETAASEPNGSHESPSSAAKRAADALFSAAAPAKSDAKLVVATAPADTVAASDDPTSSPRAAGRILQAIDDVSPASVAAASDLARTPARRGRPPGSKNKIQRAVPALPPEGGDGPGKPATHATAEELIASLFAAVPDDVAPPPPVARDPVLLLGDGPRLRFSWIKKELQPGERWKRRLSRICW